MRIFQFVMRGLEPHIHRLGKMILAKKMDRRVKPGDDNLRLSALSPTCFEIKHQLNLLSPPPE
jgi:hypothetical protein